MGNSAMPGLTKRGGVWHIDKQYRGVRICESTGTGNFTKAQELLAKRMNDIREAHFYGVRASHTFEDAATKYLEDFADKKSIGDDARSPYPLTQEEQALLFQELPDHLARMALFKVNTGCREQEVCGLRWDYEVKMPELNTSVFLIPKERVKNEERLVVLNRVAKSVVDSLRGLHPTHVFVHALKKKGGTQPVKKMLNTAWKSARERAADEWSQRHGEPASEGFRKVRVHDLKHTFGRRLRAAGVSYEDRQDLLGHKSGRITTHYSQAELGNLIAAADKVCESESRKAPATTWLRRHVSAGNT